MAEASCDTDELYGTSYRKQSLVIYTLEYIYMCRSAWRWLLKRPSELEDALSRELHFEHSQQLRVIASFSGDLYSALTRKKESAAVMPIFQWFLETIYWPTLF